MKVLTAKRDGINWIWYLDYQRKGMKEIEILRHYRIHKYEGKNHPETKVTFEIIENNAREVMAVIVDGVGLALAKPISVYDLPT